MFMEIDSTAYNTGERLAAGGSRRSSQDCRSSPRKQHGYTRRRSPTSYERTTTVRLICASDGRVMCTKLKCIQQTRAKPENGTCLCENYLKGHCDFGFNCPLAHVSRHNLWEYLVPRVNADKLSYEPGFRVRCYAADLSAYYDIPSECIYVTQGSQNYVDLYNENSDNFREKVTLCGEMQKSGCCEKGTECEQIHCCYADLSGFNCTRTHIASEHAVKLYDTLPVDVIVRVFQPNSGEDGEDFPGSDVLRTVGAAQYETAFLQEGRVPKVTMQHCAHFQNKKMCRMGSGCRFLHVVSVALSSPDIEDDATSQSLNVSPRNTPLTASLESNPQARLAKNNIANMLARGMKNGPVDVTTLTTQEDASANQKESSQVESSCTPSNPALEKTSSSFCDRISQPVHRRTSPVRYHLPLHDPSVMAHAGSMHLSETSSNRVSPLRRNNPYAVLEANGAPTETLSS